MAEWLPQKIPFLALPHTRPERDIIKKPSFLFILVMVHPSWKIKPLRKCLRGGGGGKAVDVVEKENRETSFVGFLSERNFVMGGGA